jgi:hypothetical protein
MNDPIKMVIKGIDFNGSSKQETVKQTEPEEDIPLYKLINKLVEAVKWSKWFLEQRELTNIMAGKIPGTKFDNWGDPEAVKQLIDDAYNEAKRLGWIKD